MSDSNIASELTDLTGQSFQRPELSTFSNLSAKTGGLFTALLPQSSFQAQFYTPHGDEHLMLAYTKSIWCNNPADSIHANSHLVYPRTTPTIFPVSLAPNLSPEVKWTFSSPQPVQLVTTDQQIQSSEQLSYPTDSVVQLERRFSCRPPEASWDFKTRDHVEYGGVIGRGASGTVAAAYDRLAGQPVCIKQIVLRDTREYLVAVMREILVLKRFSHVNLLSVFDAYSQPGDASSPGTIYLVTERMDRSLETCPSPTADMRQPIMFQLLSGLAYLHSQLIRHGDIKPANILINEQERSLRICDFGWSQQFDDEFIRVPRYEGSARPVLLTGTLDYLAPENIMNSPSMEGQTDVFAAGLVFLEMFEPKEKRSGWRSVLQDRFSLFATNADFLDAKSYVRDARMIDELSRFAAPTEECHFCRFPDILPQEALLIWNMLQFNPINRHSVESLLESPYFTASAGNVSSSESTEFISMFVAEYPQLPEEEAFQSVFNNLLEEVESIGAEYTRRVGESLAGDKRPISSAIEQNSEVILQNFLGAAEIGCSRNPVPPQIGEPEGYDVNRFEMYASQFSPPMGQLQYNSEFLDDAQSFRLDSSPRKFPIHLCALLVGSAAKAPIPVIRPDSENMIATIDPPTTDCDASYAVHSTELGSTGIKAEHGSPGIQKSRYCFVDVMWLFGAA